MRAVEAEEQLGALKQSLRSPRQPPPSSREEGVLKAQLAQQLAEELSELQQQNRVLKAMVKAQKSETRTKDMQNAQLRRKVAAVPQERERRPVPLNGQASPAAERPPINKMQVLSGV